MIENIKHLHTELYVEVFRDSLDLVVLEHGEVQIGDARTVHDIAARITTKIEALRERGQERGSTRVRRLRVRRCWIAIRIPKGGLAGPCWCDRDGEAIRLDIILGMARI